MSNVVKCSLSGLLILICGCQLMAQNYKFGKVSKEELEQKFHPKDSTAPAAVLYREVQVNYQFIKGQGFDVHTTVHERVKVYSKQGFDFATVSERLYVGGNEKEHIAGLKGYTYNLVDGKVVEDKLKKDGQFTTEVSKYRTEERFTMPNVKEGSVVEYTYEIMSPYIYSLDEMPLQYDIPIDYQVINYEIPEYFVFAPKMKGHYLDVQPKYSSGTGIINFSQTNRKANGNTVSTSFSNEKIDYLTNVISFEDRDIPALEEEPYVNNMENYRRAVNFELQYVQMPNKTRESYVTTWEQVVKRIYESDDFGGQLSRKRFFEKAIEPLNLSGKSEEEKLITIFRAVQGHMNWNQYYGYFTEEGVKNAYEKRSGNIADINLLLVGMLEAAELEAKPVLLSIRSKGVPVSPTMEGFNYVIGMVQLKSGSVLLDASRKYAEPNILPVETINWFGRAVAKDGTSSKISLQPNQLAERKVMVQLKLSAEGELEGRERRVHYNHFAYEHRAGHSEGDEYLENLEKKSGGIEVSNYSVKGLDEFGKPVIESFEVYSDRLVDVIGDKVYVSPMLYHRVSQNPFKREERNFPVDFGFPWSKKVTVDLMVPEGYSIVSKPEDVKMLLPDNLGSFTCITVLNNNAIRMQAELLLNTAVLPQNYYDVIKEFYQNVVEKGAEKVVLSKSGTNGDTSGAAGGR